MSFQVLGHMKTVCVLILGWLLFDSELTLKNILGMAIAVLGMVVYSWAVESDKKNTMKPDVSHAKNEVLEEHEELLKLKMDDEFAFKKDVELGHSK